MSISKQHQEWLSLLEISGPFLAMPVVTKVFPHGLPKFESGIKKELRIAYQEWLGAQEDMTLRASYQTAWIRFILRELLGYPGDLIVEGSAMPAGYEIVVSEHGEKLAPDAAIIIPKGRENEGRARILVTTYPATQQLERGLPSNRSRWGASPATRMMELLRRTSTELGLVTNGEQWMLVYAPVEETTTFASWYASVWMDEEITLQSFHALLSVARIFGVSSDETLESLFCSSTEFQQEVTDQLGIQVRKAVELLIQALDRIDKDTRRSLLKEVSEKQLYEAGVSVMMRLVFLLAAEERGLFPLNNEIYATNYAVSTLREQLQESAAHHGESVLEHRYDAWIRLLATFRVIHGGCRHEDLNSPAYGGSLFDPDKYPFLEGRSTGSKWYETEVDPLAINNRTILHMLDSLQVLKGRGSKDEARKLSFRAIDVEQIGNVYESLLEHTGVRAAEPVLGLVGSKRKEPEVPLSVLETRKELGETALVQWLVEETGKTEKSLSKLLYQSDKFPESKCLMVCDNDNTVYEAVKPFLGLVREDTLDMPVVITPGSVYVTEGSERRSTGTHYTPRSLTEPIVEHALNPLVYTGLSDGVLPTPQTLREPSEILDLKVCDMTCGSGAFLVQACRFLAEKLVESWGICELNIASGSVINIHGEALDSKAEIDQKMLVPANRDDRVMFARRLVADRCLYGIDCNPMAVEMAKLSLWLTTLQRDRPFTFVDHAIKCGDSLIGITTLNQLKFFDLSPRLDETPKILVNFTSDLIELAKEKRLKLEQVPMGDICDTEVKERLNREANELLADGERLADILVGVSLRNVDDSSMLRKEIENYGLKLSGILAVNDVERRKEALEDVWSKFTASVSQYRVNFVDRKPFHWTLGFPEVFLRERSGFDAIIGNPPFISGKKLTGIVGSSYRDYLISHVGFGRRGSADICAYFLLRAQGLIRRDGCLGLLATNTISEGETREVGLDQLCQNDSTIFRAVKSQKWPGAANLEVAKLWIRKGSWNSETILDEEVVTRISSYLAVSTSDFSEPNILFYNAGKSFIGSYVLGMGFVLDSAESRSLVNVSNTNEAVVFPYLTADDVNSDVKQSATRSVINFFDWPLRREDIGSWVSADGATQQVWLKDGIVPLDYPQPVAEDYPECFEIVAARVKPERTRLTSTGEFALRYPLFKKWWIYADKRPSLYASIANLDRVLVIPLHAKYMICCWQNPNQVFSHGLAIVASDTDAMFAIMQSTLHEAWAHHCGSTMRVDPRYTPSKCFETFPFPTDVNLCSDIGKRYHEARQTLTQHFNEGLTKIYNRVHSRSEKSPLVAELRALRVEMDCALMLGYGWTDISLDHDFRSVDRSERFTISESCKDKILNRMFELNQKRYLDDQAKGLTAKGKGKGKAKKKADRTDSKDSIDASPKQITLHFETAFSGGASTDE